MIRIVFDNMEGLLNPSTNEVYFLDFKYKNILVAITNIHYDIESKRKEFEVFENLIKDLM